MRISLVLLVISLAGWTGCRGDQPAPSAAAPAPKTMADHFDVRLGGHLLHMQFAVLQPETERGLMERRDLGPDDGMIFVFRTPQRLPFWMHDTPTPLDVGYFTPQGVLAELYPLLPFDERPVVSISSSLQFAVETNQGWYRRHGVAPGARLNLGDVEAGLRARGFDPEKFGLGPE